MTGNPPLHAVIGICHEGHRTRYFRRSMLMANFPGVWSLPSIQFLPPQMPEPTVDSARPLFGRMAAERFGDAPVEVLDYLTSGSSDRNPMGQDVTLHLFRIRLPEELALAPDYYTEAAWLTTEQYEIRTIDQTCGLCTRLWAAYAWREGIMGPGIAQPA